MNHRVRMETLDTRRYTNYAQEMNHRNQACCAFKFIIKNIRIGFIFRYFKWIYFIRNYKHKTGLTRNVLCISELRASVGAKECEFEKKTHLTRERITMRWKKNVIKFARQLKRHNIKRGRTKMSKVKWRYSVFEIYLQFKQLWYEFDIIIIYWDEHRAHN